MYFPKNDAELGHTLVLRVYIRASIFSIDFFSIEI
jgi:hypothetical protein